MSPERSNGEENFFCKKCRFLIDLPSLLWFVGGEMNHMCAREGYIYLLGHFSAQAGPAHSGKVARSFRVLLLELVPGLAETRQRKCLRAALPTRLTKS